MTHYRLLSFKIGSNPVVPGVLIDGDVISLADINDAFDQADFPTDSLLSLFENWSENQVALRQIVGLIDQADLTRTPLDSVTLDTPLRYPQALYCAGANYVDHIEEMTGKTPNKDEMSPFFFLKPPRPTLVASGATVKIPDFTQQLDWEAEIALVIGREAREVDAESAMDYVAGLTILNDLSARDLMKRYDVPFLFDWIGQKCFTGAAPTGPWITPLECVDDPGNLDIKLWVNDHLFQDSNSKQMIFTHAELIANLSKHITLYPGDIIATGTPAGVGHGQGKYLKSGDIVRIEIGGLGSLRNQIE